MPSALMQVLGGVGLLCVCSFVAYFVNPYAALAIWLVAFIVAILYHAMSPMTRKSAFVKLASTATLPSLSHRPPATGKQFHLA
jgi:hypothetical protein